MSKSTSTLSPEKKMRADPAFKAGMNKIDREKLRSLVGSLEVDFATDMVFHNLVERASQLKARNGELDRGSEKRIAKAGGDAIRAGRHAVGAMKQMTRMLASSGLDKVVEANAAAIFRDADNSPAITAGLRDLARLGMHDDALKCARRDFAKAKYNPLRLQGANGTLEGLVAAAEESLPRLENFVAVTAERGLPTIVGGSQGTANTVVTIIIIVGVAIIIGSFFY